MYIKPQGINPMTKFKTFFIPLLLIILFVMFSKNHDKNLTIEYYMDEINENDSIINSQLDSIRSLKTKIETLTPKNIVDTIVEIKKPTYIKPIIKKDSLIIKKDSTNIKDSLI